MGCVSACADIPEGSNDNAEDPRAMTEISFFEESKEQSKIKAAIVSRYFVAWASVIVASQKRYQTGNRIAYIDLFAGPGRYADGTISTPLLVLERAIQEPDLQERLVTYFNDKDADSVSSLSEAVGNLKGVETLRHKPVIRNYEVGPDIVENLSSVHLVPTLFFVDPWGYKGLSLGLIHSVVKDWGCDCIFFFNYNRINMGLTNPLVKEHMEALFGETRANELRERIAPLTARERELNVVEELCQALRELGPEYVLPFRFKSDQSSRTSHHLIFVSKHLRGYEIMKDIMAKESSAEEQGVASFEYNPEATRSQQLLFSLSRPLDELGDMLLEEFAGQTLTMRQIYERHNVNRPYIKSNYKKVLWQLEEEGKITASPHRRNSFADTVCATFPKLAGDL